MKEAPSERHIRRCGELFEKLLRPLRAVARIHGYALGVHGSVRRDIDLIAAPWTRKVSPPELLAESIRQAAEAINGFAFNRDAEGAANPDYFIKGAPGAKPHGRLGWAFHLGGGPYIDLSVLPPAS